MNNLSRIISYSLIFALAISCGNGARKADGRKRHSFPLEREQNLSNYLGKLLSMPDLDEARRDIDRQMAKIEASGDTASFRSVLRLMSHYLYDPNSPMRDEDIYQVVAERASRSKLVDSTMYARYALEARMAGLNRRGTRVNDFVFEDESGHRQKLCSIPEEYIVLFFSNPGCPACKAIKEQLTGDQHILMLQASGKLAIVNIYIDSDIEEWRKYCSEYPRTWYNGFDPSFTIRRDRLFSVRAIPSLYLLDGDRKVLAKDLPPERLFPLLSLIPEQTAR